MPLTEEVMKQNAEMRRKLHGFETASFADAVQEAAALRGRVEVAECALAKLTEERNTIDELVAEAFTLLIALGHDGADSRWRGAREVWLARAASFRGARGRCETHDEPLVLVWRCEEPANMNGAPRSVCPECLEERAERAERERDEAIRRLKEKGESDGGMDGR